MTFARADGNGGRPDEPVPVYQLTTKQRAIVEMIETYERVVGEACSISLLARQLRLSRSALQDHLGAIHRKGWLRSPHSPLMLRRPK